MRAKPPLPDRLGDRIGRVHRSRSAAGRWLAGGAASCIGAVRRYARPAATVAAGRGLTALGGLVGVRVLTESLSPVLFGRYKLALAGLSLAHGVLVRPFIQHAMRAYHDAAAAGAAPAFLRRSRRWFGRYAGGLGAAAVAGGYLAAGGGRLSLPELAGVGAVLVLQALVDHDRALFVTRARQRDAETIAVATQWLIPFAVAALVRLEESLRMVLAAHAAVLAALAYRRWVGATEREPADGAAGPAAFGRTPAWDYAWPLMVGGSLHWLLHESDRFILGYYHGPGPVGVYAAAWGLAGAPFTAAAGAAAQVMYPVVFAASARRGGAFVLPGPMLAGTLLLAAGGVSAVWWAGDLLAAVALAESYRAGVSDLLVWIALGYACYGVSTCFDLAAFGAGRTTHLMAASGAAAALNVGLDLLLVPAAGAAGAAGATAAALFVYLLCMAALFVRAARGGGKGARQPPRCDGPPGDRRHDRRRVTGRSRTPCPQTARGSSSGRRGNRVWRTRC